MNKLCKCGCGRKIFSKRKGVQYIFGHAGKETRFKSGKDHWNYRIEKGEQKNKFCKCGCGRKISNKYIYHFRKYPEYLSGHFSKVFPPMKGKKMSIESIEKQRKKMIGKFSGNKNPMYGIHLIPWNKNLTKKNNDKIKNISILLKGINKGKHPKTEFKKGHDNGRKNKKLEELYGTEKTKIIKKKMRESKIKYIEETKLNGGKLSPTIGRYEKEILDNLEKEINYPILRGYYVDGFWVDGYCKLLNLVIEIDENHHQYREIKDKEREDYIKNKLNCFFLRIPVEVK